jgi:hypothetical protein
MTPWQIVASLLRQVTTTLLQHTMNAILLFLLCGLSLSSAFVSVSCPPCHRIGACQLQDQQRSSGESFKDEAERLLAQARALRAELPPESEKNAATATTNNPPTPPALSPWTVPTDQEGCTGVDYRLDIDMGRESGTWMDPRWGASGKRIEFTLDVRFATTDKNGSALAGEEIKQFMVKDNFGGKSSPVYILQTAVNARLRNGNEKMKCYGGGYRIDTDAKNGVARFYVSVEGTPAESSSFGDVIIPAGCLYFSIPVFGGSISQMSSKEGLITVRQVGWHTGWRREESRIVGNFRAKPMQDAKRRDKF